MFSNIKVRYNKEGGALATHSSIPAQEIPRTEEPGGPQSMGSKKSQT